MNCELTITTTGAPEFQIEVLPAPASESALLPGDCHSDQSGLMQGPPGPAGPTGPQGPAGPPGSGIMVTGEIPAGAINGSNATFTAAFNFIPESVEVQINGLVQRRVTDFNTTGTQTIILTSSPTPGETVQVDYQRA